MSWESFWLPNLIQYTVFAAISAIVSASVALLTRWAWRKWGVPWIKTVAADLLKEQRLTTAAADEAVAASRVAAEHAKSASVDARTAGDNSRQANEVLEWLVPQIAARDAVIEGLRERIDRLLGTRARLLAAGQAADEPADSFPSDLFDGTEAETVTGRHRLQMQLRESRGEVEPDRPLEFQ